MGENEPQNVRDFALLCIARDNLAAILNKPAEQQETSEKVRKQDAIKLVSYSADLDAVPTIDQVSDALGSVVINSRADAKRAKDMKTWADIIKSKQ